mgnify:FL=1|tara:strand:- start:9289 stop:11508 length:2220 start_codon:yes stop_codon:yes gene_type:complete
MAVKLNITTNVTGQGQITKLNSGLTKLSTQALIAKKRIGSLERAAAKSRATFSALGTTLKVGVAASLAAVTFGLGKFVKDTFAAGRLTESLQVRFKLLFNSVEEGSKAFEVMNNFASKVPFSLEAIAAGSGNLAVITENADDLGKILQVTGNVAAATGLDFRQTAEQIQRAFAGGIAAADVFRERGVRAMLGFEAGAKVSIEETRKRFFEVFGNGGQFSTATKDFEQTLEAQVSFVEDAYFRFRQAAAQPLFAGVKAQLVELVGNFKENDTQLKAMAKTIGEGLAKAFENLGKFVKTVIENFDKITLAVKTFIALKVAGFIGGLISQFILLTTAIKGATFSIATLNIALRANIVGILITGLQVAAIAVIAFKDELLAAYNFIKDFFIKTIKSAAKFVLNLASKLKLFPTVAENAAEGAKIIGNELENMRIEADQVVASYTKLTRKQKELFSGASHKAYSPKFSGTNAPNIMGEAQKQAAKAAEELALKNMAINERIDFMNRRMIIDEAKARTAAQEATNRAVEEYRKKLAFIGIESKAIAGIISNSWLNGIREGNSLLEITKTAFKNVFVSISDMLVKRSAELLIERLFIQFADQKIIKQRQLNAEVSNQSNLMSTILSKGSGIMQSIGGIFSGGKGFGNILGSIGSFFKFSDGGIVPGGAPYTDRVPAMLTPGEVVIPRNKTDNAMGSTSITNINISGNVDQRSIDQIKAVISQSSAEVGGANRTFQRNSQGVRGRGR